MLEQLMRQLVSSPGSAHHRRLLFQLGGRRQRGLRERGAGEQEPQERGHEGMAKEKMLAHDHRRCAFRFQRALDGEDAGTDGGASVQPAVGTCA